VQRLTEHHLSIRHKIAMQATGFSGAGDFAGPDVQAVGLLAVDALLLETLLQPLPILLAFCLGKHGGLRVFLCVALEDAGADEVGGVIHGMYQSSGVVYDEFASGDGVFEPSYKVFGGWLGVSIRWHRYL